MKKRMNRLNELVFNCNKCCRGGSVNSQWFASHSLYDCFCFGYERLYLKCVSFFSSFDD